MPPDPALRFFLDHNVAESAARTIEAAGHGVRRLRSALPVDSNDGLVAAVAMETGEILVSHDRDFKAMAKRFGLTGSAARRFAFIKLSCFEPDAAARLNHAMTLIEHEWRYHGVNKSGVLHMEIMTAVIRTMR